VFVAQGHYFAGLELPGFRDFVAPSLPIESWHPYEKPLAQAPCSEFYGRDGRTHALFSKLNNGGEQSILADTLLAITPTDSLFLAHTVSLQSIPYLGCGVVPCAAPVKILE